MTNMIDSHGKLLFTAFIVLLLGAVLIQPLANDTESVKTSSSAVANETVTLSLLTTGVTNETLTLGNTTTYIKNETLTMNTDNTSANLSFIDLTALHAITNVTGETITGSCNVTLTVGQLTCNTTHSNEIYVNYTYVSSLNGTLAFDDLTAKPVLRNFSSQVISSDCNVTLSSGAVACNHTHSNGIAYTDYTYIRSRGGLLANDELLTFTGLRNITSENVIGECNITFAGGTLLCNNTHSSTAYADYTYTPDNFVRSSAARTLLNLTILFFALGILGVGIGFAVKSFKKGGIM